MCRKDVGKCVGMWGRCGEVLGEAREGVLGVE